MTEPEQAFRDALRRADGVEVPVPPIDPAELKRNRRQRPWQTMLAAAAAVTLVAGVGVAVWMSMGRGVPAVPISPGAPSGAPSPDAGPPSVAPSLGHQAGSVEVDIYSGRENPVIGLDNSLADELYATVEDYRAAGDMGAEPSPLPGLGFRGFVVTPLDRERPPLRILPGSVQVDPEGESEVLRDPTSHFFDAIASSLDPQLRDLVASGSVQLRLRNSGLGALDDIAVQLPSHQLLTAGRLGAGAATGYQIVGQVYSYARIIATQNGEQYTLLPADYVGETPLSPGRYTYEISAVEGQSELDLTLVRDADGGWPEETSAPDGEPADGPAGATATWEVIDPDRLGPESTEVALGVTRLECAGGVTGEVLEPVVTYHESEIVIRAEVAPLDDGPHQCQGNDVVPVVVKLAEPIGDRDLVDAACLAGEAVTTSFCAGGPVRWTP